MTPTSGTSSSSPTPFEEPIQPEVNANAKEGVQESSGPEATTGIVPHQNGRGDQRINA